MNLFDLQKRAVSKAVHFWGVAQINDKLAQTKNSVRDLFSCFGKMFMTSKKVAWPPRIIRLLMQAKHNPIRGYLLRQVSPLFVSATLCRTIFLPSSPPIKHRSVDILSATRQKTENSPDNFLYIHQRITHTVKK